MPASDPARTAIAKAIADFSELRHEDGHFEGFSDAGVVFDAANVLLSRFVDETWPEPADRIEKKMRHVLSGQGPTGLFYLYPGGPPSVEATRIVVLAIERVLEDCGASLETWLVRDLEAARTAAKAGIARPPSDHFELLYLYGFRFMIEALDANASGTTRDFPSPKLLVLVPVMLSGLLPKQVWRATDRIVYPFIAVLPQLLTLGAWRCVETSRAGGALKRALDRMPKMFRRMKQRAGKNAASWLLERQDEGGGFYYSPLYTYLFVAGLRDATTLAESDALSEKAEAAIARALAYIRQRETIVPTGISTSFVASDVWDTTAVATSFLDAPVGALPSSLLPETLGAYPIALQSPSGGFSYGRGSRFPDVDTTGLVMGLFAALVLRDPKAANRDAMIAGVIGAFDFLEKHRSAQGGFNAWTIRHGENPPPMPSELTSMLFDVPSADVTSRVLVSLRRVHDLVESDSAASARFGDARKKKLSELRKKGLKYLLSVRDPQTGLWPARWSLGYVIGTRFAFDALESFPEMRTETDALRDAAARTLVQHQNADGGFGESPESDLEDRYVPSPASAAFVTAAAYGVLAKANGPLAKEAAARAMQYLVGTQHGDGTWTEVSLCTQFAGLYASYSLMTEVAIATTLFRAQK